jgi:type III restriction enzyme
MADGFVKEPAVVTQKNFNPRNFSPERIEEIKLEDGVRLHESVKVELETYARQYGQKIVKPFVLVIARDTTHAGQLQQLIKSEKFFEGRYASKVIQVDSSKTGAEEEEMIQRLLAVESTEEPTEIVIHVNMLKEGWDVTNLYTIVPLRAANARILIEQSIGRGLRLPYGKKTGVNTVDRLNIVAHDKFQEIIDEANRSDSVIRLQQVILDPEKDFQKTKTVVAQSNVEQQFNAPVAPAGSGTTATTPAKPVFANEMERNIAKVTYDVIKSFEHLPNSACLVKEDISAEIYRQVAAQIAPQQLELAGVTVKPNIAEIVKKTTELVIQQTIDIPRILIVPKGEVSLGYHPFTLEVTSINFQPVARDLLMQHLRTGQQDTLTAGGGLERENRLEDYIVRTLIDFNDITYDSHADLLYDLSGQMVRHLLGYLSEDEARNVLQYYQKQLAEFIHVQMQAHQWESATEYEVKVNKGFSELKASAFTATGEERDFRQTVEDKSKIGQMVFGGFKRCLYAVQKFQSDTERRFAVILDRDAQKWFDPPKGNFRFITRQAGTFWNISRTL